MNMNMTMTRLSVLMYHRLSDTVLFPDEAIYTIAPARFESQMRALVASGRSIVSMTRVLDGLADDGAILLTFDDGTASDFTVALPVLRSLGLTAAFFVNPATIGREGFLSWSELESLAAAGMHVGSHGLDHTLFDELDDDALERQLADSKTLLEERLERPVTTLSLPGGTGEERAPAIARKQGYRLVFGSVPRPAEHRHLTAVLPRFAVRRSDTVGRVVGLAEQRPWHLLRAKARHDVARLVRRAAGERLYETARRLRGARAERSS